MQMDEQISIKMVLLKKVIVKDPTVTSIVSQDQLVKLERFVNFSVYVLYIPWWLTSPLTTNSPQNDFAFIKSITKYPDPQCSSAATKAIKNHLWYLTPELLPLSLFSSNVEDFVKEKIAKRILEQDQTVSMFLII